MRATQQPPACTRLPIRPAHLPPPLTLSAPSRPSPARCAAPLELSLVVCDDAHITELNREWRGVDGPTDVLSFELEDDEDETGCKPEVGPRGKRRVRKCSTVGACRRAAPLLPPAGISCCCDRCRCPLPAAAAACCCHHSPAISQRGQLQAASPSCPHAPPTLAPTCLARWPAPWPQLPVNVLGDVVISLDTAARQAAERRYRLLDEARVLLVHGVLHLLGYDHEEGARWARWACWGHAVLLGACGCCGCAQALGGACMMCAGDACLLPREGPGLACVASCAGPAMAQPQII